MHRFAGLTATLLMLAPAVMSQDKDAAVEKELAKLKGQWRQYSSEQKGKERVVPDAIAAKSLLTIDGNTWTIDGPMGKIEQTFKIDPTKSPKEFDRIRKGEDGKDVVDPCIYKLDGDTLTICSSRTPSPFNKELVGKERPKEFKTTDGGSIIVYKRVKE
jgi:uncharacterized protein (TIGR03067 family)